VRWAGRRLALGVLVGGLLTGGGVAGAQEATRPPEVVVVGDSLAVRSEYQLRAVFRNRRPLTILAITDGAYVDWVRRRWVDDIRRDPPSILVVGLGHGDGTHHVSPPEFARQVRAFLDEVGPYVDCIRWLDVRERWTYYRDVNVRAAAYNRVLRREAAHRRKLELVHWSTWADQADDSFFEEDRLHPARPGRWVYARMARDAADGCDPDLRTGPYWDVLDHEAHAPAVRWLRAHGILQGDHGNGTFEDHLGNLPQALTRSEMARWLWRRAGRPSAPRADWPDVGPALRRPADWVAAQGLLSPLSDGTFRRERPVRRGELLRALWLLAGSPTAAGPAPWTDLPPRLVAAAAWANETGVLHGFADGTFRPTTPAWRDVAAIAVAPQDLPAPAPPPEPSGPYPPPIRLHGDPPGGPR
jgi:hypothetical protein